jgi:hypothetical protein
MKRREIVAQRVSSLVDHFDRYVSAYDLRTPFSRDQLAAHRATLAARHQAGSVNAAVANPRYVASLRQTLTAWDWEYGDRD